MKNSIFIDLSLMGDAPHFDGMAAGTFVDMYGRKTTFEPAELMAYVTNTKRALESTRDASGQIVGFPIDALNHDNKQAAGWIVDVSLALGRDIIEFTPRWNDLGRDLIGRDVMRYFSPSIDIANKVILGGSLTNWPATRTTDHQLLLKPVELSAQMSTYDDSANPVVMLGNVIAQMITELKSVLSGRQSPDNQTAQEGENMDPETTTTTEAPVAEVVTLAAPTIPAVVDLSSPDVMQLINERAEAALLAEREQKAHIAQLATRLTGGTTEKPVGLTVGHDRIVSFLSALPTELLSEAEAILLSAAEHAAVSFEEIGHSRTIQGTQQLPDSIKPVLSAWLGRGLSLEKFFEANSVELGVMSDYDLSQFANKEGTK
jgi:hypothetical protein